MQFGHAALEGELSRRLPWLLVFRAGIATLLLIATIAADLANWPLGMAAVPLYGIALGSFAVVLVLGMLMRASTPPLIIAAAYLALAVASAVAMVQATGVIESQFSFLFLLAVLDGAIVGGRRVAVVVATSAAISYGLQIVLQLYGIVPAGLQRRVPEWEYSSTVFIHFAAFFLMALLAGYLAELLRRAHEAATLAADDLQIAHELHTAILGSLPVGVITFDEEMLVRTANPAVLSILGLSREELAGRPLPQELRAAMPPTAAKSPCERQDDTRVVDVELRGRQCTLALSRAAIVQQAEPPRAQDKDTRTRARLEILVVEDRTAVASLERRLRVRDRLASIGELAAGIAHEIRNPLAAISGSLELLLQGGPEVEDTHALSQIALREAERLNRLVDEFLQYARPAPVERAEVDIAALARELCAVMQADVEAAEHALVLHCPDTLVANVDTQQMRQVLWNLVRNAVEAAPSGSAVEIDLREQLATPVGAAAGSAAALSFSAACASPGSSPSLASTLAASAAAAASAPLASSAGPVLAPPPGAGRTVVIEVRDHGRGIDARIKAHLFEPFRTTKDRGTGLGLAMVHRIVDNHGGTIDLTSTPGEGTTARVVLPQ